MSRPGDVEPSWRGGEDGSTSHRAAVAFAVLGGMGAWVLHLGGSYALVPVVCGMDGGALLHLLTAAMALVAAGATWTGWRVRARLDSRDDRSDPRIGVLRFLARSGFILSAFFLLLILVEGVPALLSGDPFCPVPTLDAPIIRGEPMQSPSWAMVLSDGR